MCSGDQWRGFCVLKIRASIPVDISVACAQYSSSNARSICTACDDPSCASKRVRMHVDFEITGMYCTDPFVNHRCVLMAGTRTLDTRI